MLVVIRTSPPAFAVVDTLVPAMALGASVKGVLRLVARKTGLGDRRVRALWNKEARAIRSTEMDRLRLVALEAARAELLEIEAAIARADALAVRPAEFVRPVAHAEGEAARLSHRPMASRD